MRPALPLLASRSSPGLLKRSFDEFKNKTHFALTFAGLDKPSRPELLLHFDSTDSLAQCVQMCDSDAGGRSQASLDFVPASKNEPSHAKFYGVISTYLPEDRPSLLATGYAGFRTADRKFNLFGFGLLNLERYRYLAMRIKPDGRKYMVNVQTDSIEPTDLHQHRLYTTRPGEWQTVVIDLNEFVRTNNGALADPQADMMTARVNSVGLSLTDRVEGPFELCIQRIWATNGSKLEPVAESDGAESQRFYQKVETGPHIETR